MLPKFEYHQHRGHHAGLDLILEEMSFVPPVNVAVEHFGWYFQNAIGFEFILFQKVCEDPAVFIIEFLRFSRISDRVDMMQKPGPSLLEIC